MVKNVELKLFWSLYSSLYNVRRAVPGFRLAYVWGVGLLGMAGKGGLLCSDVGELGGVSASTAYGRLDRLMKAGYVERDGYKWVLSAKGSRAFAVLQESISDNWDQLRGLLAAEVRRRS